MSETDPETDRLLEEIYRSLPPDLELPGPEEPTDQYRIENFEPRSLEDLKRYGEFMVALMVWSAGMRETERTSFMPTARDFDDMHTAGYGVSTRQLQADPSQPRPEKPGLGKVQSTLKFYPRGFVPEADDLRKDLKALAQQTNFDPASTNIKQILSWARTRDLLPSESILKSVIPSSVEVRMAFSVEKHRLRERMTFMDVYRFGAQVLRDNNGRPPTRDELDTTYGEYFLGSKPHSVINAFFGSYRQFWLEFDLIVDSSGMTEQEAINAGTRHVIATSDTRLTNNRTRELSKNHVLPLHPIQRIGFRVYQKNIDEAYGVYLDMCERFEAQRVNEETMRLACFRTFEATAEFEGWLLQHVDALQKLSGNGSKAAFLRERIEKGIELDSLAVHEWRLKEIHKILDAWELNPAQKRFVFDLIPRVNTDEALGDAPPPADNSAAVAIHYHTASWHRVR